MIGTLSILFVVVGLLIAVPATAFAQSTYEAYRGVKISDYYLQGARGTFTVKSLLVNTAHRDFFVYLNFYTESSTVGAGYFVSKDTSGNTIYWDLIYSRINGGFVVHDLYTSVSVGTSFLADVRQTSNGSNCYKATTYGGNKTFCLNSSTTSAGTAGAIARAGTQYSSTSNTMSGVVDYLGTAHYNSGYVWKYFTDAITNESKCYSTDTSSSNSWVEDDLLKRATTGSTSAKFDKIGFGPTLYTTDDCTTDQTVWSAFGST